METKVFEIRDSATFIPVLATKMASDNEQESYLIKHVGYSSSHVCILVTYLAENKSYYDPFQWSTARTMPIAHQYIINNFDELATGSVIDVQFILGETDEPKLSERLTARFDIAS